MTVRTVNVLAEVEVELARAMQRFASFPTLHHGYAVLLEEVDELWEEVKQRSPDPKAIRKEAVQVAAMAVRFVADLCDHEEALE